MARRRRRSRKRAYRFFMFILIVVAAVVGYFVWESYFNKSKTIDAGRENSATTSEKVSLDDDLGEVKAGEEHGQIDQVEEKVEEKEKVIQYEGGDPNVAESLSGAITYANAQGDVLIIRLNIDQYLADGVCRLSINRGGVVIYEEVAEVDSSAATSTCRGFNVKTDGLGEGDLEVVVDIESGGRIGKIIKEIKL